MVGQSIRDHTRNLTLARGNFDELADAVVDAVIRVFWRGDRYSC
jgi:hypothetical protein